MSQLIMKFSSRAAESEGGVEGGTVHCRKYPALSKIFWVQSLSRFLQSLFPKFKLLFFVILLKSST